MQHPVTSWKRIDAGPDWEAWEALLPCGHGYEQRYPPGTPAYRLETVVTCSVCAQAADPPSTDVISKDGRWRWDGTAWQPNPQHMAPGAPPKGAA
jgi:hypothetical protein